MLDSSVARLFQSFFCETVRASMDSLMIKETIMTQSVTIYVTRFSDWQIHEQEFFQVLSAIELEARQRIVVEGARRSALVSRYLLRRLLGQVLDQDPAVVDFSVGPHGKPRVEGLFFNVSHSADLWACALSKDVEVGFDVEVIESGSRALVRRYFSSDEQVWMSQGDGPERFAQIWSGKEAALKLRGERLLEGLEQYSLKFDQQECIGISDNKGAFLTMARCEVDPSYVASLCTDCPVSLSSELLVDVLCG